jgi:hypothetical protein
MYIVFYVDFGVMLVVVLESKTAILDGSSVPNGAMHHYSTTS